MKIFRYILSWFLILLVFTALAGYFYVQARGKVLVERQLTKFFHQSTTLDEVRFLMPFGLRIKGLNVTSIVKADDVRLQFSLPLLSNKELIIRSLDIEGARFSMVRYEKSHIEFGGVYLAKKEGRLKQDDMRLKRFSGIMVESLSLTNSQINVMDIVGEDKHPYVIKEFSLKASSVSYPLADARIRFSAQGVVEEGFSSVWQGQASVEGWFNWPAKNMEARLEMMPFTKSVRISADVASQDNIMNVFGNVFVKKNGNQKNSDSVDDQGKRTVPFALDVMNRSGAELDVAFHFQTYMDAFDIQTVDYEGDMIWHQEAGGFDIQKLNPLKLLEKAVTGEQAE